MTSGNQIATPFATASAAGGRSHNEDAHGALEHGGTRCFVVADGLGGHRGGEVASQAAVRAILESFREDPAVSPAHVRRHLEAAQSAVCDCQKRDERLASCRSTAVVLLIRGPNACWGHVGDTRLYWFRGGRTIFQTADHSVPQALASAGEIEVDEIRAHPDRNRLLRSLGNAERFEPAVASEVARVEPGDAFLLCTDGFWELVVEAEMAQLLVSTSSPRDWMDLMVGHLCAAAPEGHDNFTGTAVRIQGETTVLGLTQQVRAVLLLVVSAAAVLGWIWLIWIAGQDGDEVEVSPPPEPEVLREAVPPAIVAEPVAPVAPLGEP